MKTEYIPFYLDGREDSLVRHSVDPDDVAATIMKGGKSVHEALQAAAEGACKAKLFDKKKSWLKEHAEDIKDAGGNQEDAWLHYLDGKTDALIESLEPAVIEALNEITSDGDEDGDEEDDDDDDEDDEPELEGDS